MNAKLVIVNSCCGRQEIVLQTMPVVLGRAPDAAICVPDRWVSRRHCEFDVVEGRLVVRDLESKHGTFVNGQEVVAQATLLPGDQLSVGTSIFTACYEPASVEAVSDPDRNACLV